MAKKLDWLPSTGMESAEYAEAPPLGSPVAMERMHMLRTAHRHAIQSMQKRRQTISMLLIYMEKTNLEQ